MHRLQLFCHNQGIYLNEYIQMTKYYNALHPSYSENLLKVLDVVKQNLLFFYLGFLSQIFMIHRTAGEGQGYLSMTCLICLVSVMIYISICEEFIYGMFEDCIGLCNSIALISESPLSNTPITMAILQKCLENFS